MKKNKAEACNRFGAKTNFLNGRSESFSDSRLSRNGHALQSLRIYEVTNRPDHWRIMDHDRILLLQIDCRRYRDQLAAIARIAGGGQK